VDDAERDMHNSYSAQSVRLIPLFDRSVPEYVNLDFVELIYAL